MKCLVEGEYRKIVIDKIYGFGSIFCVTPKSKGTRWIKNAAQRKKITNIFILITTRYRNSVVYMFFSFAFSTSCLFLGSLAFAYKCSIKKKCVFFFNTSFTFFVFISYNLTAEASGKSKTG